MKIFGREPALWLGLIAISVKLLAAFGLDVSAEQQAILNATAAALVGLILAVIAGDAVGAAVLGFAQAALALAVGFGLDWSAEQQAVVLAAAAAVVAMWDRTQITAPASAAAAPRPLSGV